MLFIFSTPVLIIYLLQLKTFVFKHWYIISAIISAILFIAFHTAVMNIAAFQRAMFITVTHFLHSVTFASLPKAWGLLKTRMPRMRG